MIKEEDLIEIGFNKEYCDDGSHYFEYTIYDKPSYDLGFITTASDEGELRVFLFPYDDIEITSLEDIVCLISILTKQMSLS